MEVKLMVIWFGVFGAIVSRDILIWIVSKVRDRILEKREKERIEKMKEEKKRKRMEEVSREGRFEEISFGGYVEAGVRGAGETERVRRF